MPSFDRATLGKFLPDQKAIAAFEALNKSVDTDIPAAIGETDGKAEQAFINAQQALDQLVEVVGRVEALEFAPVASYISQPIDDLAPAAAFAPGYDDLSPVGAFSAQSDDFAPRI